MASDTGCEQANKFEEEKLTPKHLREWPTAAATTTPTKERAMDDPGDMAGMDPASKRQPGAVWSPDGVRPDG